MSEPLSGRIVQPGDGADPGAGGPGAGGGLRSLLLSRKLARAWMVPVVFGVVSVALGVLVLAWPGHTVGALTV
ncbi:MAG: hypothetical protein ACRDSS_02770, partial [Actinocrinis sp.]